MLTCTISLQLHGMDICVVIFVEKISMSLSVFIITLNEAARIEKTIIAAQLVAKDIVVIDSGSTDETVALAKQLGARVFFRPWTGYGAQKRFGEDQCQHTWVLNLDADEELTEGLASEILMRKPWVSNDVDCLTVRILHVYPGDNKPKPLVAGYEVVRLYNRQIARFRDHPVFDRVVLSPDVRVEPLNAPIYHHSFLTWQDLASKWEQFSAHEISRVAVRGTLKLILRLPIEYLTMFIKMWIGRRHVFGGWKGMLFSHYAGRMRSKRIQKALRYRPE